MVVTLNNTSETKMVELTVWELGIPRTRTVKFRQLMVTGDFGYSSVKNSRVQGRCAASRGAGTWGYPGEVCAGVENWKIGRKPLKSGAAKNICTGIFAM